MARPLASPEKAKRDRIFFMIAAIRMAGEAVANRKAFVAAACPA